MLVPRPYVTDPFHSLKTRNDLPFDFPTFFLSFFRNEKEREGRGLGLDKGEGRGAMTNQDVFFF